MAFLKECSKLQEEEPGFLVAQESIMMAPIVTTKDENSAGALAPALPGRGQSPYPMVAQGDPSGRPYGMMCRYDGL